MKHSVPLHLAGLVWETAYKLLPRTQLSGEEAIKVLATTVLVAPIVVPLVIVDHLLSRGVNSNHER